jgi:hypothetical protein
MTEPRRYQYPLGAAQDKAMVERLEAIVEAIEKLRQALIVPGMKADMVEDRTERAWADLEVAMKAGETLKRVGETFGTLVEPLQKVHDAIMRLNHTKRIPWWKKLWLRAT